MNSGRPSEVVLAEQPDAHAGGDATAAPGALVGRRLRHRLDRQPLHLEPMAVAGDARRPGVDHVAHARHRERRLRDVRGEHDAPSGVRLEDAVLLDRRQPGVQRQHLGVSEVESPDRVRRVVDLALAAQEHEHVARALVAQFLHGVDHGLHLIAVVVGVVADGPVPHLDRVGAALDRDDRCRARLVPEVRGEAFGVDRGRRDDELQVGPLRQQLTQVAEQEVDVQAPLVGLVDDDRVVPAKHPVALDLGEQDAVGHHLHERLVGHLIGEAHRVADGRTELDTELVGHALGDGAGSHAAGLRVADHAGDAAAELQAQLGQLGALAGSGLTGDDHDLVVLERGGEVVPALADRQPVGGLHHAGRAQRLRDLCPQRDACLVAFAALLLALFPPALILSALILSAALALLTPTTGRTVAAIVATRFLGRARHGATPVHSACRRRAPSVRPAR